MVSISGAYSGFAARDLAAAAGFYRRLGIEVVESEEGLLLPFPGGGHAFVYAKPDHEPAGFSVFYVEVDDIDRALDELAADGIRPERYEGFPHDDRGVVRGRAADRGPDIAWVLDPSGNVVAITRS
jgi:catechol 2,3-dioxygenase-like lactoylglutathione lyase family enzyme